LLGWIIEADLAVAHRAREAEYGSDAIAGVVNIILRKTYTGAEVTAG
jgi:outer membrane cobalamin receptor